MVVITQKYFEQFRLQRMRLWHWKQDQARLLKQEVIRETKI